MRFQALHAGRGMKMNLPGMETPSLVMKKFHTGNSKGQEIDKLSIAEEIKVLIQVEK